MAKNDAGEAVSQDSDLETAAPDKKEYPQRTRLFGQWCDRVDSPLPDYPGCIYVVTNLSSPQFVQLWEKTHAAPDGNTDAGKLARYNYLWDYARRQHLVLAWHIQGVSQAQVEDTSGKSLPAVELAGFVINATMPAVIRAMNPPNLPGWWPIITPTATSESEMGE